MNSYHDGVPPEFFAYPDPDGDAVLEKKLQDVFMTFCPTGEMDGPGLVNMLREGSFLDQKFTPNCIHIAFMKARHISDHTARYESKVILAKRLLYDAFREVAIPCVAEAKGTSVEAIIDRLKVTPSANVECLTAGAVKKDAMQGLFVNAMQGSVDEVEQMQKLFSE
jgi:hypothetical protein